MSETTTAARKRMSHDERHAQLLRAARDFIREEGSDAVTLARIADHAGVTKPLVYQHFGTRAGLLAELYSEFKTQTHVALDRALIDADDNLQRVAQIIADAYIDCIDAESTELPGISGALSGSAELERLRADADEAFSDRCRIALEPFAAEEHVSDAAVQAILGAADGLARALVLTAVTFADARVALARVVAGVVSTSDCSDCVR
jgi:AcrR family transcriptional regulator